MLPSLATSTHQVTIDRAGGISPLVALLLIPNSPIAKADGSNQVLTSKKHAAAALARLSTDPTQGGGVQARSRQENVVSVALAASRRGKAQAGETLPPPAALTKSEQIAQAGAIEPLVGLLNSDYGQEAQEEAAGALFALAHTASNRLGISEAGGIGPLVELLGSDNAKARGHAEGALVRLSIENTNRVLIIKQLVGMLNAGGDDEVALSGAQQAAAALANLARESVDNRTSIVEAGGIAPLLTMLNSGTMAGKENTMQAIMQLANRSRTNQEAIVAAGGIPILVCRSPCAWQHAVHAPSPLN